MYYKKFESENLYLSPMHVDDYQIYTKWVNDESLASGVGNFKLNITELSEKEWIENVCKNGEYHFSVVRKIDNKLLGTYGLKMEDSISRRMHMGGFIGDKEDRGKGYGTEALKLITKYAFEILNANTLFSGIYSFNEASLASAKKSGYSVVGRYRDAYFYNNQYWDEICVDITREDYEKNKSIFK